MLSDLASCRDIGDRQLEKALELHAVADTKGEKLKGPVQFRHMNIDMTEQQTVSGGSTCSPAMGYSFAAGTTDGPAMKGFAQGDTNITHFLWDRVRDLYQRPSDFQSQCHYPKPILLSTGEKDRPYAWQPSIVEVQILCVGQLWIVAVPGEFTTMAGRRLKERIHQVIQSYLPPNERTRLVIAGLSNLYTSYVTTIGKQSSLAWPFPSLSSSHRSLCFDRRVQGAEV